MAMAFINKASSLHNEEYHADYNDSMVNYQVAASKLRLGYVPGVIRHHYHGTKQSRQYTERWKILMKHSYSPITHLAYDAQGILIPTKAFPEEFKEDIMNYFRERKEDSGGGGASAPTPLPNKVQISVVPSVMVATNPNEKLTTCCNFF